MSAETNKEGFLVIGRAGMDLYADPPGTPIEKASNFKPQLGGSAGNIAIGLARQSNAPCSLLSAVSDDAIGAFTKAYLKNAGVDINLITECTGYKNTLAIVDTNGDLTQASIYRDSPADLQISKRLFDEIDLAKFSTIIITGTALTANPSRDLVLTFMSLAKKSGKELILDIDYRKGTWESQEVGKKVLKDAITLSSSVVGNEIEFDFIAGGPEKGRQLARDLSDDNQKIIIYKMGSHGCILYQKNSKINFGAYKVKAIKPTGAGDAFLAGFCSAWNIDKRKNTENAIINGAASAAIVVTKVGCSDAMPNLEEIESFINTRVKPKITRT